MSSTRRAGIDEAGHTSVEYCPPEVAKFINHGLSRGQPKLVSSPTADMWAMGATLFTMVSLELAHTCMPAFPISVC